MLCFASAQDRTDPRRIKGYFNANGVAPPAMAARIEALRQQKAAATEADLTPCLPALDVFFAGVLEAPAPRPEPWDQARASMMADRQFRRLLGL